LSEVDWNFVGWFVLVVVTLLGIPALSSLLDDLKGRRP
jgi:hypothetical protein